MASRLTVWFTADVHDRRGFGSRLRALVGPDELLVDCGDSLRGSSQPSTVRTKEWPKSSRARRTARRRSATANSTTCIAGSRRAPARCRCPCCARISRIFASACHRRSYPELTVLVAGLRVRLLALLVPQYRTGSGWERIFGWRFLAPHAALARAFAAPEAAAADVTLLLSHVGLRTDRKLAASFPQLGAILGGHSHDTLEHPEMIRGVPIVHAGAYAHTAGRLELDVGGPRPVVVSYRLVPLVGDRS